MKINTSTATTEAAQDASATNIIQLNLAVPNIRRGDRPPLPRGEGTGEGQTGSSHSRRSLRRHQVNRSRAAWWFGQMRKVVNAAIEWKPTPVARPEQTYITLDVRQ